LDFLLEYGLFFAKIVTFVIAVIILLSVIVGLSQKNKQSGHKGHLEITPLNELYDEMSEAIKLAITDESQHKAEAKKQQKEKQKEAKEKQKALKKAAKSGSEEDAVEQKPRVFVVNFHGNISASAVTNLREEVTAILSRLQSAGSYSQAQYSPDSLCRQSRRQRWLYDGLCCRQDTRRAVCDSRFNRCSRPVAKL